MKIEHKETEMIVEGLYDSSNILASKFNKRTGNLIITFKGGRQYIYENVKYADFIRFDTDNSQGKIFNTHIKNYTNSLLGTIDVEELIKEITEKTPKVLNEEDKKIVSLFKTFIEESELKGEINKDELKKIKEEIEKVLIEKIEE